MAQFNLGFMYYQGQGVSQSHKGAAVWHRKAADQGKANAQYNLGLVYHGVAGGARSRDRDPHDQWGVIKALAINRASALVPQGTSSSALRCVAAECLSGLSWFCRFFAAWASKERGELAHLK